MVASRLDEVLRGAPPELLDSEYFSDIYNRSLEHFLKTPRDVTRLINGLALTYGPVKEEVNVVDFIAIETLRIFRPEVYDLIRSNPEMFCEESPFSLGSGVSHDELKKFHDSWITKFVESGGIREEDLGFLKELLMRLFPRLGKFWSEPLSRLFQKDSQRPRRIRDLEIFPIYFRLSVPETTVSRAEFLATLALGPSQLAEKLSVMAGQYRPDGMSRARAFVETLPAYINLISTEKAVDIIGALLTTGDVLMDCDKFRGWFIPQMSWLLAKAVGDALRKLPKSRRLAVLCDSIEKSGSIGTIMWLVHVLGEEHGKYGSDGRTADEPIVSTEDLSEVERLALVKVRTGAESDNLLNSAGLLFGS